MLAFVTSYLDFASCVFNLRLIESESDVRAQRFVVYIARQNKIIKASKPSLSATKRYFGTRIPYQYTIPFHPPHSVQVRKKQK